MADDVMALDERLARLEVTVANGFSEQSGRITSLEQKVDTLEQKFDALNSKLDVVSESLEDKIQLVLERLDSRTKEMLAATESMRREWRGDRRLMYAMLKDHRVRIDALEKPTPSSHGQTPGELP